MQAARTLTPKARSRIGTLRIRTPVVIPEGFVLVSRKQFEQLLEDLEDLAVVLERRNEKTYSWEDLKARLKRDGLL